MFERLSRIIRSFLGYFIELGEDPELILRQNIKDMQDQVPAMNQNIAMIKANVTLLEKEKARLEDTVNSLTSKIKAALKTGRRDIALNFATTLEQAKEGLVAAEGQLKVATEAYEKAQSIKQTFLRTLDSKSKQAMNAVQAKRRAEWQGKIADSLDQFKVAGIDATHDEMISKIEQQAAEKEARMSVALDNIDHAGIEVEREAEKLEANETLRQFELEMGLSAPEEAGTADKTIGSKGRERNQVS